MTTLSGPVADAADTPASVTTTAAATLDRVASTPAMLQQLSAEASAQLKLLVEVGKQRCFFDSLGSHRLQVSIRGQRFEMAMDTALNYYLSFYLFFSLPVDVSVCDALTCEEKAGFCEVSGKTAVTVASLCALSTSENNSSFLSSAELCNKLLLAHYCNVVMPLLDALTSVLPASHPPPSCQTLPPLATPEEIIWDRARTHWQFVFPRRLPEGITIAEENRLDTQRKAKVIVGQEQGEQRAGMKFGQIYTTEPNDNPFLLLQPHFMGIIVVLTRRATKQLDDYKMSGGAIVVESPTFPVRWRELDYDTQLSLAQLVRSLGVSLLHEKFAVPTADVTSSDFYEADGASGECKDDAMAVSHGQTISDEKRDESENARPLSEAQKTTSEDTVMGDVIDVAWVRQGCAACGMSGHATADCHFAKKGT